MKAYAPSLDDLTTTLNTMPKYGLDVACYVAPGTELAELLLMYAALRPMDVYALANSHRLTDLAQKASSHLLSFPLANVTDEMAERTGAVALKKLFFLHLGRIDAVCYLSA